MSGAIELIVGLGNPGNEYAATRHNVGFWFVDEVAAAAGERFKREAKFSGDACRIALAGHSCWLLKPSTFMNRSGQAVAALATFYKIAPAAILVVHDELDLPPGVARFKQGGGHGGHNGLRSIIASLGTADFLRLRIGIGHPGDKNQVVDYVLHAPGKEDRAAIDNSFPDAVSVLPLILAGDQARAMNQLHSKKV